jgi:hypothetical protein
MRGPGSLIVVRIVTHILVVGTTRAGKTRYTNKLHRTFPGISIFVDTKGSLSDAIWGVRTRNLDDVPRLLKAGHKKIVWDPPRTEDGIDFDVAGAQLRRLWGRVQHVGTRTRLQEGQPYIQLVIDEAQQWEGFYLTRDDKGRPQRRPHPATLEDMAARGLGLGLRLVYVTQYPTGLQPKTRTNLNTRIIFAPGDEGERCLQQWGWPLDLIKAGTAAPWHFLSYVREWGWCQHAPIAA